MTVLITGGAGYIGSLTARLIRASGRAIVILDTLENGHRKAVGDAPFVQGDVADSSLVERICSEHGVDEVVHFAAYKAVGESMSNPEKYFNNNVIGSQKLFGALNNAGVERVVFSSTAAVYGTPATVPVQETDPLHCESVYAETKLMIENTLRWYAQTTPMRHACLRYFNAAGASDDATLGEDWRFSQNLIPHVMKAVLGHSPALQVFGNDFPTPDGTGVRDYIHVMDLAEGHLAALEVLLAGGDQQLTLNLGSGQGHSVLEVIKAFEAACGHRIPYVITSRRSGDAAITVADPSEAQRQLGWQTRRTLKDICRDGWHWQSRNPRGYSA